MGMVEALRWVDEMYPDLIVYEPVWRHELARAYAAGRAW